MNDNEIINKIIDENDFEVINKGNVELLVKSFETNGLYFCNTNLDNLNEIFNNKNIKIDINIAEFLRLDCLVFSNEKLIEELLNSGYKDTLEISKDFPNIV